MTIPKEAVEASAKVLYRELGGLIAPHVARAAIEAAAPHMLAEAWDEGFDRGFYDPLAGGGRDASESPAANPYRAAK